MVTRSNSILRGVSPSRALSLLSLLVLSVLTLNVRGLAVNQFLTPTTYPTGFPILTRGASPNQTLGDFNGDGKLDVFMFGPGVPPNQLRISVLPGKGDGTFGAPTLTDLAVTINGCYQNVSQPLAVGDFNGDGKLDVAVLDRSTQGVGLLLGNGDGTFRYQAVSNTFSVSINSLLAADFNRDGKADLVVSGIKNPASSAVATVQVLLGNGDGTFQAQTPATFPLFGTSGHTVSELILGDFNLDGKIDVVLSDNQGVNLYLLPGNGDGTFQSVKTVAQGTGFGTGFGLIAMDLNGDGKLDIAEQGKIFLGNGDGSFRASRNTAISFQPSVALDFNGDGKLDAFGSGLDGGGCLSLGNGDGTFQTPYCFAVDGSSSVADINGDGKLDLVGFSTQQQLVSVALGFGDGTFPAARAIAGLSGATSLALGDFNGDGNLDLAATTCSDQSCTVPALVLLFGNPDGTFRPPTPSVSGYVGGSNVSVLSADFNGDGKMDLLTTGGGTTNVFLGKGDGTFLAPIVSPGFVPGLPLIVADFNHDGRLDLVGVGGNVLLGKGDGTFGAPISNNPCLYPMAAGDFNGDGKLDFACFTLGSAQLFLGNGDGTFHYLPSFNTAKNVTSMVATDLNGDGKLDLAIASTGSVVVYNGNGDGSFVKGKQISPGGGAFADQIIAADFNGDGRPDIAGDGLGIFLALNSASGAFKRELFQTVGTGAGSSVSGDFNHDGALDLAALDGVGITVYLNSGAVSATLASSANPSKVGQAVTFQSLISPTLRGVIGTPTGTVTFKDGVTVLGIGKIKVGGTATFTASTLGKGNHSITATYSGDSNFIPKTSLSLIQVVQ